MKLNDNSINVGENPSFLTFDNEYNVIYVGNELYAPESTWRVLAIKNTKINSNNINNQQIECKNIQIANSKGLRPFGFLFVLHDVLCCMPKKSKHNPKVAKFRKK